MIVTNLVLVLVFFAVLRAVALVLAALLSRWESRGAGDGVRQAAKRRVREMARGDFMQPAPRRLMVRK